MFNINALLKFINVNNDNIIQKSEMQEFISKVDKNSIFDGYFNSISDDIDNETFLQNIYKIIEDKKQTPQINFKDENDENKFQQLSEEEDEKDIPKIKKDCLESCGIKVKNMDEFEKIFDQFKKEAQEEGFINNIYQKFENLEYTKPITMEMIKASKVFDISLPQDLVFPDIDWSKSRRVFDYLAFNDKTFSNTSKEHLPKGYDPQVVFEKGKSIGLGIDEVHEMGYTGKGVSYAIIDSGTLCTNGQQHNDIHFKEYHVSDFADKDIVNNFHGQAVSYIAQEIAPDADCYYYAQQNGTGMDAPVLDNLKQILEKNKTLPDNEKIRFVSMSMQLYGGEESKQVVEELEKQGVWVYYSGCPEDSNIAYLNKKDPMGNPNDFDNYQIANGSNIRITDDGEKNKIIVDDLLYVNSGNRTVPDPSSETAYRHDSMASQSWSVPVIAGYYTLACQVDPSMTKEKFLNLANQTAQVKTSTLPIYKGERDNSTYEGQSEETTKIKIIDIKALIQAIEEEKAKNNAQ